MAEILLVEDSKDLADLIADILGALNLLLPKIVIPDLIVTDLVMPEPIQTGSVKKKCATVESRAICWC